MKTWTASATAEAQPAAGCTARVWSRPAGRRVGFDVHVHAADVDGLAGPEVHASISVRPNRGLTGRLLAEATTALLDEGALDMSISRLVREAAATA